MIPSTPRAPTLRIWTYQLDARKTLVTITAPAARRIQEISIERPACSRAYRQNTRAGGGVSPARSHRSMYFAIAYDAGPMPSTPRPSAVVATQSRLRNATRYTPVRNVLIRTKPSNENTVHHPSQPERPPQ
jgi:hypothetical protein